MADRNAFNLGDLRMYVTSPTKCLEEKPTTQSVVFCDEFINLTKLKLETGLSCSFLSMMFAKKCQPSVRSAKKIASALGMELGEFFKGLGIH